MELLQGIWNAILDFTKLLVIPDWGALIALLPVFMGVVVIVFFLGRVMQYRRLGPRRRRPGRIQPVTPAGVHMPGPTFAPILAAFGTFVLFAGLVYSSLLIVGGIILLLTLLYWGREAIVDYDHVAGGHAPLPAVVHPGPPPGVHMPGPSFQPFMAALGVAVLFAGLVYGGWILVVGLIVTIAGLLSWLNDFRKEYRQVVRADVTGHLENEPAPDWPRALLATSAILLVASVVLTAGWFPPRSAAGGEAGPGGSAAPSGGPGGSGGPGPGGIAVTAANLKFDVSTLTAPADKAFKITFDNKDASVSHDVDILDTTGKKVFDMTAFPGPETKTFDVTPLAAGSYKYECSIHPSSMNGTLTVGS